MRDQTAKPADVGAGSGGATTANVYGKDKENSSALYLLDTLLLSSISLLIGSICVVGTPLPSSGGLDVNTSRMECEGVDRWTSPFTYVEGAEMGL